MALFRKRCDSAQALALLHAIVVPDAKADERLASDFRDLARHDRFRHEFNALRLFAVLAAGTETRHRDWRDRGRELFDQLFESTLRSIMAERGDSEFLARSWLAERVKYYALAQHIAAFIDDLGTEAGKSFGMLFSQPPPEDVARLGRGVFFRAFEQTLARHGDFKLA